MSQEMNQEVKRTLHDMISKQLNQSDFDVIGVTPLPAHKDRMVRLQSLQEILEDSEEFRSSDTIEYLIQIKPRTRRQTSLGAMTDFDRPETGSAPDRGTPPTFSIDGGTIEAPTSIKAMPENIYLTNGKLNVGYLFKNADLLFDSGDYPLAKNIYKTILKSGENTSIALFKLGRCFEAEGKPDDAIKHYDESITYHPTLESYQKLSFLLQRQNREQQAAETLERALNLKELSSTTRFELLKAIGNCWTKVKKLDHAERSFKKALEINPTADEIRSNLGALYLQSNVIPEAKRYFRDATASNPKNHLALAGLGSCALAEGDKKAAHDYFAKSLEIELNNPNAVFYLVKCAYELKSYAVGAKLLGDYIQIAAVNPNLLYSLAGLQFHIGRIPEAKATTLKILEIQPQHAGAKDLLNLIERYTSASTRN